MNIIADVARELMSMFMADAYLALSILGLVAFVALLIKLADITPLLGGGGLLAGSLIILISAACREAKKKATNP